MSVKENIEVIRRLEKAYADNDFDTVRELIADDWVPHTPGSDQLPPGVEGIEAAHTNSGQSFPDRKVVIEDIFGEGDLVVSRCRITGTNKGGLPQFGIPANQKRIDIQWIQIARVDAGKVRETWATMEVPKLMMQLGAMPGPEA